MRIWKCASILIVLMVLGLGYASNAEALVKFLGGTTDVFGATDNQYDSDKGVVCDTPKIGADSGWVNASGQQVYLGCKCPDSFQYNTGNCSYPYALDTIAGNGVTCDGNYDKCTCIATYNSSNCPSPKVTGGQSCEGKYTTCTCPSNYQYTSSNCASPKVLGGGACDGKYASCTCPSSYQYNSSNCPSPQVLGGGTCDGNYSSCSCPSNYQYTCTSPQQGSGTSCGGKYTSCTCPGYQSCSCGAAAGASSCTPTGGSTLYSACASCCDDTCPSGYSKTNPGGTYTTTTTGCGNTCYQATTPPAAPAACDWNFSGNRLSANAEYWNADGPHTATSLPCVRGYGAYSTVTMSGTFQEVIMSFWQGATIQGGSITTSKLMIGLDPYCGGSGASATFKSPVTVNGEIWFGYASSTQHATATFSGGLSGNYTCVALYSDCTSKPIDCAGLVIK